MHYTPILHSVSYAGVWPGQARLSLDSFFDKAAELGYVDEVIRPEDTRPRVIRALEMLRTKRQTLPPKKHGNIPL